MVVGFDESRIDAIFRDLDQCHLPGAAVGVAVDGKPVYRKGFGLANIELPVTLSPTIRMRIGSTTKHFTALAFMLMCEDGLASIDDTVMKYFPELHPVTHRVTMRQLMESTSGLRDVCNIKLAFSGIETRPVTSEDLIALYRKIGDVNFAPGAAWLYNNGGWLILSAVIERICGLPLEELLRTRIFEPIGMRDTLLRRWDTEFVPNSATSHMTKQQGGRMHANYGMDNFSGAGAIASTVDDMLRWLAHMDAPIVGTVATWKTLRTPAILSNGTSTNYGFGLFIHSYRGVEVIHHPGSGCGCNAEMVKVPCAGLDISIMINREDVSAAVLATKIIDACVRDLNPSREPHHRRLSKGVFRSAATGRIIELSVEEGRQVISIDGMNLIAEPDDTESLRPTGMFSCLKQAIMPLGNPEIPDAVRLDDYGNVDHLSRVPPAQSIDQNSLCGRYLLDSGGIEAVISPSQDGLLLETVGQFGMAEFRLECIAKGIWRATTTGPRRYIAVLTVESDAGGFTLSTSSLWLLRFRRVSKVSDRNAR